MLRVPQTPEVLCRNTPSTYAFFFSPCLGSTSLSPATPRGRKLSFEPHTAAMPKWHPNNSVLATARPQTKIYKFYLVSLLYVNFGVSRKKQIVFSHVCTIHHYTNSIQFLSKMVSASHTLKMPKSAKIAFWHILPKQMFHRSICRFWSLEKSSFKLIQHKRLYSPSSPSSSISASSTSSWSSSSPSSSGST